MSSSVYVKLTKFRCCFRILILSYGIIIVKCQLGSATKERKKERKKSIKITWFKKGSEFDRKGNCMYVFLWL